MDGEDKRDLSILAAAVIFGVLVGMWAGGGFERVQTFILETSCGQSHSAAYITMKGKPLATQTKCAE